jgi:hypothetical protein
MFTAEAQLMSEVFATVEGRTEQTFIRDVFAPWLAPHNVYMTAIVIGKQGGNEYASAKLDILNLLKQRSDTFVTCMFDFYGMKDDWPGRQEANGKTHDNKPTTVEDAVGTDIIRAWGSRADNRRFRPFVAMHEFESLLFSDPASLAIALGDPDTEEEFASVRNAFVTPEHINDSPLTAPSKRIAQIFVTNRRVYRKPLHGSIAAKHVTIETMIDQCPHFRKWVIELLALG